MNDESKLSNVTKKITKVDSISDEEFIKLVKNSNNISEISEKIGYSSPTKSGRKSIKNRIETLNLDTSHFKKYLPILLIAVLNLKCPQNN